MKGAKRDYVGEVRRAIEQALALQDDQGQPVCLPKPDGGWVIECNPQEAQEVADAVAASPMGAAPWSVTHLRIRIHLDLYMPPGMMRALPYDVWERRTPEVRRAWGCELDTDGDGDCPAHPDGCPTSKPLPGGQGGDPAFPVALPFLAGPPSAPPAMVATVGSPEPPTIHYPGMSLRDWFAGLALQGFLADPNLNGEPENFARNAYQAADAMLAERAKLGPR